jgi:type VI secretion system secreted protein VgrG
MPNPTQQNRLIAVETPLGPDKLLLTSFSGQEQISRLFSYQLDMLSSDPAIDPLKIVLMMFGFSVNLAIGQKR